MDAKADSAGKCPVVHGTTNMGMRSNSDWWPNQLNLRILHQNSALSDPMGAAFDYAEEFKTLNLKAVKKDLTALMTESQEWWPADYGHYGGLFIRMAWHSAGTYRIGDGRGGAGGRPAAFRAAQLVAGQRQPRQGAPPAVADQAEVRQQDLVGRPDDPRRQRRAGIDGLQDLRLRRRPRRYLGAGGGRLLGRRDRVAGTSDKATAAIPATAISKTRSPRCRWASSTSTPKGRTAIPTRSLRGRDIRETFARMAMNDEETVALTAGGHTFGKTHGAGDAEPVGPEPEAAPLEAMGLGWLST